MIIRFMHRISRASDLRVLFS